MIKSLKWRGEEGHDRVRNWVAPEKDTHLELRRLFGMGSDYDAG